jgi:hypothetical protein
MFKTFLMESKPTKQNEILSERDYKFINMKKATEVMVRDIISGSMTGGVWKVTLMDGDVAEITTFELDPFGSTKMLSWEELSKFKAGDTGTVKNLEGYLRNEALRYSMGDPSSSSFAPKRAVEYLFMKRKSWLKSLTRGNQPMDLVKSIEYNKVPVYKV